MANVTNPKTEMARSASVGTRPTRTSRISISGCGALRHLHVHQRVAIAGKVSFMCRMHGFTTPYQRVNNDQVLEVCKIKAS